MKRTVLAVVAAVATFPCFAQGAPRPESAIALVMIHAARDSFTMGDGVFGPGAVETLSSDFSISKYPITNSQFAKFISDGGYGEKSYWTKNGWEWKGRIRQPAYWTDDRFNGPDQPVVGVSWYEAVAFCNWLSAKEGLAPAYESSGRANLDSPGYRLPTEVEWEYAAAKGGPGESRRIYPWGNTWNPALAVCRVRPADAVRTADVESKSPQGDTPQGLADMAGNVWEWCSDNEEGDAGIRHSAALDRYYFQDDSPWQHFVLRGGAWVIDFPTGMRAGFRSFSTAPELRYNVFGFRIVRRQPPG